MAKLATLEYRHKDGRIRIINAYDIWHKRKLENEGFVLKGTERGDATAEEEKFAQEQEAINVERTNKREPEKNYGQRRISTSSHYARKSST